MMETFVDDYAAEYWMTKWSNKELLQEELKTFYFTHDLVGGQLLKKWLFPENLIAAVANHHLPGEAVEEKIVAHVIQLADLLSFYCCNQEFLRDDDILTVVRNSLPFMRGQWRTLGIPVTNDTITEWFDWLLDNYEQGSNLKEAFFTCG